MGRGQADSVALAEVALLKATEEVARADLEGLRLERERGQLMRNEQKTLAEIQRLHEMTVASEQRKIAAANQYASALQRQRQVEADNLRQQKDFISQQERYFRGVAAGERGRLEGLQSQYGSMANEDRYFAKASIGEATSEGWGFLSPEERDMAARFMPTKANECFKEIATREAFPQALEQAGETEKLREAEWAEKLYAEVSVKLEQTIDTSLSRIIHQH
jgi:predicted component of type VI protein secretion system